MKPRIFIGSSVEGLNIAYSIQQNLTYDAEVTVWDQGVFELSKTTIESLTEVLIKSDFGIFVFSPDDIVKIKEKDKSTLRDNVLFEFGLFIGKLSRERVFFVIPSDMDLYLPTDLLGITPGKYDSTREDGSLQAALGPVSHQIRLSLKKLGRITEDDGSPNSPEKIVTNENEEDKWYLDFFDKRYEEAKIKLTAFIKKQKEPDKIMENTLWSVYCDFKINASEGLVLFDEILKSNPTLIIAHRGIAKIYLWEDYLDKSIAILENARKIFNNDSSLIILQSECYKKTEGIPRALEFLKGMNPENDVEIALEITDTLFNEKEYENAREHIHKIYINYPNNEKIKYKYARVAMELKLNEIALFFLKSLTNEFDDNIDYWGYLSNCALVLDYYDLSLTACKKADELAKSKQQWILSNIGNILNNKGFYSEAIKYLNQGLEIKKDYEYAHDRLASAMKKRDDEKEKVKITCESGRKSLREYLKVATV